MTTDPSPNAVGAESGKDERSALDAGVFGWAAHTARICIQLDMTAYALPGK